MPLLLPGDIIPGTKGTGVQISTRLVVTPPTSSSTSSNTPTSTSSFSPSLLLRNRIVSTKVGDEVIGIVTKRVGGEYVKICIGSGCTATLPTLAFNGATKRNRPNLEAGDIVFCWVEGICGGGLMLQSSGGDLSGSSGTDVSSSNGGDLPGSAEIMLSCVDSSSAKAWSTGEAYYGLMQSGAYVLNWDVAGEEVIGILERRRKSLEADVEELEGEKDGEDVDGDTNGTEPDLKKRKVEDTTGNAKESSSLPSILKPRRNHLSSILNKLGKALPLETAVGMNNRVYIRGSCPRDTLLVGQLLERISRESMSDAEVEVLVQRFREEHRIAGSKKGKRGQDRKK